MARDAALILTGWRNDGCGLRETKSSLAKPGADVVPLIGPVTTASVSAAVEAGRRLGVPIVLDVPVAHVSQQPAVLDSAPSERVLSPLDAALTESLDIRTQFCPDPALSQVDCFILAPGSEAAIANWVRTEGRFPGSERDLQGRGLINSGSLGPFKARILLHVLVAADADHHEIVTAFDAASGVLCQAGRCAQP